MPGPRGPGNAVELALLQRQYPSSRSSRARDAIPRELLRHGYLLLPATVDPGGQLGPLLTHFLWQAGRRPLPGLPCPAPVRILSASPSATQLRAQAHALLTKVGLFQKSDRAWRLANPARSFSPSHHLPSHWASQVLGHNVTVSMALHLQLAIAWSQPLPSLHRPPYLAHVNYSPLPFNFKSSSCSAP